MGVINPGSTLYIIDNQKSRGLRMIFLKNPGGQKGVNHDIFENTRRFACWMFGKWRSNSAMLGKGLFLIGGQAAPTYIYFEPTSQAS